MLLSHFLRTGFPIIVKKPIKPQITQKKKSVDTNFMPNEHTEEKLKLLAGIVLYDNERLDHMRKIVNGIVERMADTGHDFNGANNKLRHDIEQTEAFLLISAEQRKAFAEFFGLSDKPNIPE